MQSRKFITYLLFGLNILFAMVLTAMSPLLTDIAKTYTLNLAQTGTIFTANYLGFTLFLFIGGVLSDLWGKKKVLILALSGFTLSLIFFPLAPNFFMAFIAIIFLGGFGGIIQGTMNAIIAEVNPEKSVFYVNMAQVFFGIGAIIGPIGAGMLTNMGLKWQLCYFILAGAFLLGTFAFSFAQIPPLTQSDKITRASFGKLISDPKFLMICLCMILYTGSEVGGWGWLSTFCKQNLKFSPSESSIAVAVFWCAMTIGRLICGRLSLLFKTRGIILVLASCATVVTVLAGFIQNKTAVFLVIAAMGFAYSSLWPLIISFGSAYHPENSGTVYALLIGCGGLGATLIPMLMGIIAQNISGQAAMISPAIWFFLLVIIFMGFKDTVKDKC